MSSINDIPFPQEGQGWTVAASQRLEIPRSPYFYLSLPIPVYEWLIRKTKQPGSHRSACVKQRLVWAVKHATEQHKSSSKPSMPSRYFASNAQWISGFQVCLDAEQTLALRLWAARVEMDPALLLGALACESYEANEGVGIKPHFSLEML